MTADIVEIHRKARPRLERSGVDLRRGGIDDRGRKLLVEVRRILPEAPVDDLRVVRRGIEQSERLDELRTAVEHAFQRTQCGSN